MRTRKNFLLFICLIQALFTTLAFCSANKIISPEEVAMTTTSNNFFILNFTKFQLNYQSGYGVTPSLIFIVLAYFFYNINKKRDNNDKRLLVISYIGGALLTIFMTIGNRFIYDISITDSIFQILVTIINGIGYFFIFENLFKLFIISLNDIKEGKEHETHNQ